MPTYTITCDDPLHDQRAGEPGHADELGTVEAQTPPSGYVCEACRANVNGQDFDLAAYKVQVMALVDQQTGSRFAPGFSYAGKTFSLSVVAQLNLNGLRHNKARLVFPFTIATIDNMDSYDIADTLDADALYDTAFDLKAAIIKDGNTVKSNVRAATDKAGVDAAAASWLAGGDP